MTARDFSVMPVLVIGSDKASIDRPVRSHGSMQPGARVDVEFGVTFAQLRGERVRIAGQWRECRIVRVAHSELHVDLREPMRTTLERKA